MKINRFKVGQLVVYNNYDLKWIGVITYANRYLCEDQINYKLNTHAKLLWGSRSYTPSVQKFDHLSKTACHIKILSDV